MKRRNLILGSAISAILAAGVGTAYAGTLISEGETGEVGTSPQSYLRPFALETATATTQWSMPTVTRTVGVPINEDFYLKWDITNGVLKNAPTMLVYASNDGSGSCTGSPTANVVSLVGGGVNNTFATFRVDGATHPLSANSCFELVGPGGTSSVQITTPSVGSNVSIVSLNGTNYGGGAIPPTSPKEMDPSAVVWADFANAVTITMAPSDGSDCDDTDPIDLVPTPQTNSRKVFGPELDAQNCQGLSNSGWDGIVGETTTKIGRGVEFRINDYRLEPDGSSNFDGSSQTLDALTIALNTGDDVSALAALCYDLRGSGSQTSGSCDATESFNLALPIPAVTLPVGVDYNENNGLILTVPGNVLINPRTLTFNYSLNVAASPTVRPGMAAHTVTYTVNDPEWNLAYANGTLLRSSWFLSSPSTGQIATVRISNAGSLPANVITCNYFLDSGQTGNCGQFGVIPAHNSVQQQVSNTFVPQLGTGTASRGYFEIVLDSKPEVTEGLTINYNQTTNDRNTTMMRNLTELDDLLHPEVSVPSLPCPPFCP